MVFFCTFARLTERRALKQSVTSRLETSRYRDFSQFFESIGFGLENFGLEKSLGIGLDEIFWSRHSVYMGQSKTIFCVLGHFQHGINQPNEQPGDPTARLLMTSVNGQSFAIVGIDISFIEQKQKF